jgi:hypothetical protein
VTDRFTVDMGNHLQARIKRAMLDTTDTCESGGMRIADAIAIVASVLMTMSTEVAVILEMSTDEYVALCRAAHAREMAKRFARKKKEAKQRQS